jgi:hypothetical protein
MATMANLALTVVMKETPVWWFLYTKQKVEAGELRGQEVASAFSDLIALGRERENLAEPNEDLQKKPSWSDVHYFYLRGFLTGGEVVGTLRHLHCFKRYIPAPERVRTVWGEAHEPKHQNGGTDGVCV